MVPSSSGGRNIEDLVMGHVPTVCNKRPNFKKKKIDLHQWHFN